MDIRRIYEYALQREREGKQFFEQNAKRLNHAAAVGAFKGKESEVLQMLANRERDHERFFKQLHDQAFEEYAQMPWGG